MLTESICKILQNFIFFLLCYKIILCFAFLLAKLPLQNHVPVTNQNVISNMLQLATSRHISLSRFSCCCCEGSRVQTLTSEWSLKHLHDIFHVWISSNEVCIISNSGVSNSKVLAGLIWKKQFSRAACKNDRPGGPHKLKNPLAHFKT